MSDKDLLGPDFTGRRILVIGATADQWAPLSERLAAARSRLVLLDSEEESLHWLGVDHPDLVRTVQIKDPMRDGLKRIGTAWGNAPLHGVINLWPQRHPTRIDGQISVLRALVRNFALPLAAGEGSVVTVCAAPKDPLALSKVAMIPALRAAQDALAPKLMRKGIRLNMVVEPEIAPGCGISTALSFLGRSASGLTGQVLRIGSIDPGS